METSIILFSVARKSRSSDNRGLREILNGRTYSRVEVGPDMCLVTMCKQSKRIIIGQNTMIRR